jgi:hypothetical protein
MLVDIVMLGAVSLIAFIVFASTQLTYVKDEKKKRNEKKESK